jgi:peptidylprolyl isomerase
MDRRVIGLLAFGGALVIVVVAILVGRGGDSGGGTTSTADVGTKPTVEVPKGPAPDQLVVKDLKEGDGAEAKAGDQVSVQYVGVLYDGGKQFDASWDRGQPFPFTLGTGAVIPGWDQGVEGMKVGGRRELIIPPDLAYGAQGQPPDIPPNATLVFVIDLVSVG